jgi:NAD(P)-dependent dehydrogenase (short-subunit alcohol dehydrogenase family)
MGFDLFNLNDRVALVTGGGSGLGQAIACGLAAAGARLVVTDLSLEGAFETRDKIQEQGGEAYAERMDVTNRSEIEEVAANVQQKWGSIAILVNSAGIAIRGTVLDYAESDWDKIIAVNLKGTFLPSQVAARQMVEERQGKIINLASIGAFIAYPGSMAYLASKGGVAQLTKSFALELAPFNIQVNAIAPCLFDTPLVSRVRADSKQYFIDRTPAGRMGQPEDIVGAAVFLASDTSSMVTGHILSVDGGYLIA